MDIVPSVPARPAAAPTPPPASPRPVPDAVADYVCLPTTPLPLLDAAGAPQASLAVVLSRQPRPDEASLSALVVSGTLALGLTTLVPPETLARLGSQNGSRLRMAWKSRSRFVLAGPGDRPLGETMIEGPVSSAHLQATLDGEAARAALHAFAGRPGELKVQCEIDWTGSDGRLQSSAFEAPLSRVLGLAPKPPAAPRLLCPGADGQLHPVSERVQTRVARAGLPAASPLVALQPNTVETLAFTLQPRRAVMPLAATLIASDVVRPVSISPTLHQFALDDLRWQFPRPGLPRRALPVIEDDAAPLWPDRIEPQRFWYVPEITPLLPAPGASAEGSPFSFTIRVVGHDLAGRPGLEGTIRVTLARQMSEPTRKAWQDRGQPTAAAVVTTGLSATLHVPFRDAQGTTRSQPFVATSVEPSGDNVVATFALLDDWVRLAYGALATSGFQSEPARVSLQGTYLAYVPLPVDESVVAGRKTALIPLVKDSERVAGPHVDAVKGSVRLPGGELRFAREARTSRALPAAVVASFPPVAIRPPIFIRPLPPRPRELYAMETRAFDASAPLLLPCERYGALYREVPAPNAEPVAIGCRDTMKLGQTDYKLYAPLDDPGLPGRGQLRVYRSLAIPGKFLVVPSSYGITRFGPDDEDRAYRPTVLLFSTIDANELSNSRCTITARLEPTLPLELRRDLEHALRRHAASVSIEWLTEVPGDLEINWSVPSGSASHLQLQATRRWDGFQISLTTDVDGVPQLEAMLSAGAIAGWANLKLPDGTTFQTSLQPDLRAVVGPFDATPVQATRTGTQVVLRNRLERPVNVTELRLYGNDRSYQAVPVARSLAADESWTADIADRSGELVPVCTVEPGPASLEEIRSYIEDLHTNLVFLNTINFANHGLAVIELTVRVEGVVGDKQLRFGPEDRTDAVDLVLPLTRYLARPVVQYQIAGTTAAGQTTRSEWIDWPLRERGAVIPLAWNPAP